MHARAIAAILAVGCAAALTGCATTSGDGAATTSVAPAALENPVATEEPSAQGPTPLGDRAALCADFAAMLDGFQQAADVLGQPYDRQHSMDQVLADWTDPESPASAQTWNAASPDEQAAVHAAADAAVRGEC